MKHVVSQIPQQGRIEAEHGIFAPEPELLAVGEYIYRFAHHGGVPQDPSKLPANSYPFLYKAGINGAGLGYQAGRWWIKKVDFDAILARASRRGVDLGQTARWDLAVLQKWGSAMNVVVEARVSSKLWAWTGLAKPQQEQTPNGKVIRMFGHTGIRQLFLYDVVDRSGMLTTRGREALSVTGAKAIASTAIY